MDSPIIVLDDALASVDNKTASIIIDEIRDRNKKTIIMIGGNYQLQQLVTGYW